MRQHSRQATLLVRFAGSLPDYNESKLRGTRKGSPPSPKTPLWNNQSQATASSLMTTGKTFQMLTQRGSGGVPLWQRREWRHTFTLFILADRNIPFLISN